MILVGVFYHNNSVGSINQQFAFFLYNIVTLYEVKAGVIGKRSVKDESLVELSHISSSLFKVTLWAFT